MVLSELCTFYKTDGGTVEIQATSQAAKHTWNFRSHGNKPLGWTDQSIIKNGRFVGHVNEIQKPDPSGKSINITFDRDPNATQLASFIETCVSESL